MQNHATSEDCSVRVSCFKEGIHRCLEKEGKTRDNNRSSVEIRPFVDLV